MSDQGFKTVFPDKGRDLMLERIKDKENWGCCPKCDWFFKRSALEHCPLCRYEWKKGALFIQPKYESPSFS